MAFIHMKGSGRRRQRVDLRTRQIGVPITQIHREEAGSDFHAAATVLRHRSSGLAVRTGDRMPAIGGGERSATEISRAGAAPDHLTPGAEANYACFTYRCKSINFLSYVRVCVMINHCHRPIAMCEQVF